MERLGWVEDETIRVINDTMAERTCKILEKVTSSRISHKWRITSNWRRNGK